MKIQFIKEDSLIAIKANLEHYSSNFTLSTNSWIETELGYSPFLDTKYALPEFKLDMSEENPFLTEAINVQIVYEKLKFLTDSQASDERLWAGLCLGPFWEYVQYRWKIKDNCTKNNVEQHYFFGFGNRRSLTRNALARLWWIGRLTYDDTRTDPYELTKFVCENSNYIMSILERNTSNNLMINRSFISAALVARKRGLQIDTKTVKEVSKYLNLLGGIYILDCLSEETIHEKMLEKIYEVAKKTKTDI